MRRSPSYEAYASPVMKRLTNQFWNGSLWHTDTAQSFPAAAASLEQLEL